MGFLNYFVVDGIFKFGIIAKRILMHLFQTVFYYSKVTNFVRFE